MSFKTIDGVLVECQTFSDFFQWCLANREKIVCPECGNLMCVNFFKSFDLNRAGKAMFECTKIGCGFFNKGILIEAINQ